MNPLASPRLFPLGVLTIALALRLALAASGGQYFHFDEARHERGVWIYIGLLTGDATPLRTVAAMPEHALFPWVGAAVTAMQHLLAQATPHADWSRPENLHATAWLGAVVLALFSAANLLLVYRLARALGARREEANAALLLLAASNTAFYYARFFLPYDAALTALLGALLLAAGPPTAGRALGGGLLLGAAYHLYNGFWYAVPVIWLGTAIAGRHRPGQLRHTLLGGAAAVGALAIPLAIGWAADGPAYFAALQAFSRSVTQGDFAEGWSLPFEYAWHSEGGLGVAVALLLSGAVWSAHRRGEPRPGWVGGAAAALVGAYVLLVLLSVGLERLVVYGRTLKPLVVPAGLLGGWALAHWLDRFPRLAIAAVAGVALAGAARQAPHFTMAFPRDVDAAVARQFGEPARGLTVVGAIPVPPRGPITRPDLLLLNSQVLYPVAGVVAAPPGTTLLRLPHPLSYHPFQYEGHRPEERARLRTADISIRLLRRERPAGPANRTTPDGPPPPQ